MLFAEPQDRRFARAEAASPMPPPPKRTKIVATVGPASRDPAILRSLFLAGVNVVRLNFSHGTHDEHAATIADVRRIAHVFQTSYAAVERELPALIRRVRPDVVLLFGVATRTNYLRIELRARNARSALLPDAGGDRPHHADARPARQPAVDPQQEQVQASDTARLRPGATGAVPPAHHGRSSVRARKSDTLFGAAKVRSKPCTL